MTHFKNNGYASMCNFITLMLLFSSTLSWSQTFPVQVQPTISFPSAFLSDYNDPANINIRLLLSDVNKTNYRIKLKVRITSEKFSAVTANDGLELTLDGGQVYFLSDIELAALFNPSNLLINANVPTPTTNSLPEGVYVMSFEAFDANVQGLVVSNARTDFTAFSVNRFDPPLLNTPATKQAFDVAQINQNVFFNWTPRHIVFSPNQQIKYRFRLIKVLPVDRNPYDAMNATLPALIDVEGLDFPVFVYTPADLPLEEGSVYAWQVQAYEEMVVSGQLQRSSARFKNEGYSEVFTFSIKENCQPVTPIVAPAVTNSTVTLQWNYDPSHVQYELAYRPFGTSQPWALVNTVDNMYTLDKTQLQPGLSYEYTVKAQCRNWLEPVYGGTFTMAVPTCSAPTPVSVDNTVANETKLSWPAVSSATAYRFQYQNLANTSDPYTVVDLTATDLQYSIAKLTAGGYRIKVDALCGTELAEGTPNTIAFDETGVVGPCPIPTPFQLLATRIKGDTAQLAWTVSTAHTGYSITYWHRDSVNVKRTLTSVPPQVEATKIYNDQLYVYQITFTCGAKTTTTPPGMFRIDAAAGGVNPDPTTANCFPPAVLQAEPRSTTSAFFEWAKVDDADEYQLFYSPKGANRFVAFNTISKSAFLKDLQDGAQYQYMVRCRCGGKYSINSDTALVDLAAGRANANCDSSAFFITKGQTETDIRLCWKFNAQHTGYKLTFREEAQSPSDEYTQAFTDIVDFKQKHLTPTGDTLKYTFDNLKAGTAYIFKLQALCGSDEALRNTPLKVSTVASAKSAGECGGAPLCDKTNVTPLSTLAPGDSIYCADYGVRVDAITTSDPSTGTYSGTGSMNMPMPGLGDFVRMNVSFNNVKINAKPNSCIFDGVINIESINASVLPLELRDKVQQLEGQITDAINTANSTLTAVQNGIDQAQVALQNSIDYFQGGDNVGNVSDGGLGETTTTATISTSTTTATVNGTTVTIGGTTVNVTSLPALIKDATGNVFVVTAAGVVTHLGQYDPTLEGNPTLDIANGNIQFKENATAKYDFDEWKGQYAGRIQVEREYEKISPTYYVPAKLLLPAVTDKVDARLTGAYDKTKIKFANGKGFVFKHTLSGSTYTINLAGGPAADGQYIYAYVVDGSTKTAIGKLLAPSYAPQQKNVVIIPVGKTTINAANYQKGLNDVYARLGITYSVTVDNSFKDNKTWDADNDGMVQATGSKLLSTDYKGEEAAMILAYAASKGGEDKLDSKTAYILAVFEAAKLEDNLLGKMPAQEQFGFIYVGGAQEAALIRTVAHELGHGAYHLEHSFNNIYRKLGEKEEDVKSKSDNLMDYGNGTNLLKYQWDIVHDPGHVWGILKRDKDGQAASVFNMEAIYSKFKNPDGSLTFLSVGGKPITIKEKLKSVSFVTTDQDDTWTKDKNFLPMGTLSSFIVDNDTKEGLIYKARGIANSPQFSGYYNNDKQYKDELSIKKLYTNVLVGQICLKAGKIVFNVSNTDYLDKNPSSKDVNTTNYGEGTELGEYELADYLPEGAASVEVYANLTEQITEAELFFLNNDAGGPNLCGKEAIYSIKCAYYIRQIPDLTLCLGDARNRIAGSLTHRYYLMLSQSDPRMGTDLKTSYEVIMPERAKLILEEENARKEANYIRENYLNELLLVFKTYSDHHEKVAGTNLVITDASISQIIDLYDVGSFDGRFCMLRIMPIDVRIAILNKHEEWTISSDKEALMGDLFETARDEDIPLLIEYLKGEDNAFEKFWSIYFDLHGYNRDRFVTIISTFLQQLYKDQIPTDLISKGTQFFMDAATEGGSSLSTDYVLVCKEEECDIDARDFIIEDFAFNKDSDGKVEFTFIVDDTRWFKGSREFEYQGNPFDLIKVKFFSEYRFSKLGTGESIKVFDEAYVPAIWLYYILNQQENIENATVLRIIVDGIAIAASVLTLEPAPLIVAATLGLTDITFALNEEAIALSNDQLTKDIATAWEVVYAAYNVGQIASGFIVKNAITGAYEFNTALCRSYLQSIKALPNELAAFTTKMGNLASKLSRGIDKVTRGEIMYSAVYGFYLEAKVLDNFVVEVYLEVNLKIGNTTDLIASSPNITGVQIAKVTESNGLPVYNSLRLLPSGQTGTAVGKFINANYINSSNIALRSDLELVETANGQLYLRPFVASNSQFVQYTQIENWLRGITNVTAKTNIETILGNWGDDLLTSLNAEMILYPGLQSEFLANSQLLTQFANLKMQWWVKYGLAGLSKRTGSTIPSQFTNVIGDIEVTTNGVKARLRTMTLGDETAQTVGRAFDDDVVVKIRNGFSGNGFNDFPSALKTKFEDLYNQGYKLIIDEPRLSINGNNFDPDMLFVKTFDDGLGNITTDVKYIDIKYLDDVPYNSGGQTGVKNAVTNNGSVVVINTTNTNLVDAVTGQTIAGTNNQLTITSVEKLSVSVSDLSLIVR